MMECFSGTACMKAEVIGRRHAGFQCVRWCKGGQEAIREFNRSVTGGQVGDGDDVQHPPPERVSTDDEFAAQAATKLFQMELAGMKLALAGQSRVAQRIDASFVCQVEAVLFCQRCVVVKGLRHAVGIRQQTEVSGAKQMHGRGMQVWINYHAGGTRVR